MNSQAKSKSSGLSFEEAVSRLEEIVAQMESGTKDLDSMVRLFEEGRKLSELCNARLAAIERKVETLSKQADGSVKAEPFSEEF